jgi:LuxR family maltose regulon positive regulatory protein
VSDVPGLLSGQGAGNSDVLLATKLHLPGPRPGLIARPRLIRQLDEGLAQGTVLVSAPAGYGKTVLLAEWARIGRRPTAWLSLDAADNDPARFWRHVVVALDRIHDGLERQVSPQFGPPAPGSFDGLVTTLINALNDGPDEDEVLLILDDYHVIDSPVVHASVRFLTDHRPPRLHLAIAGRSDPPLGQAGLRARGRLAEVRATHLRFTPAEAAAVLAPGDDRADRPMPDDVVSALTDRTEGWGAGLALAALSLRGEPDVARFVTAFTGSHRYVLDYLTEEVLERQPDRVRAFLLETSVLDRLSGPLCDAVTGAEGSQGLLEWIEREGLFLQPLDDVRGWWRYHQLFVDLLRARLARQPGRQRELHRRAAAWYADRGPTDDAVRHAVAAGDLVDAARLIERHFDLDFYVRSQGATIQRWMSLLPADIVSSRPRLSIVRAALAASTGHVRAMGPALDDAEAAWSPAADEPFEPSAGAAGSFLGNVPAGIAVFRAYEAHLRGDAETTERFAVRALAEVDPSDGMMASTAAASKAVADWRGGRLDDAERGFTASMAGWRAAGQPTLMAWGCHDLGQVQRAQGRLDAARQTYRRALDAITSPGRPESPAAGAARVGLGEVAYQRNELDEASRQVTDGVTLCRHLVFAPPLAGGLATLAWIRQARGDPAGALAAMAEAIAVGSGPTGLPEQLPAERARLLLAHGDVEAAVRWEKESGLTADDDATYPREPGHLVLARVLLARDRPDLALALLGRLRTSAERQRRLGSLIEIGALQALAEAAGGGGAHAVRRLTDTLLLACPQGYVRVFADEGPSMAALVGRVITARRADRSTATVPSDYLVRVLRAFESVRAGGSDDHGGGDGGGGGVVRGRVGDGRGGVDRGQAPSAPGVPGLLDPLTERESEVLALLGTGRPNQGIAAELVVSLDTVKKHVSHVLTKLGAANRTEAVARARELGLIR